MRTVAFQAQRWALLGLLVGFLVGCAINYYEELHLWTFAANATFLFVSGSNYDWLFDAAVFVLHLVVTMALTFWAWRSLVRRRGSALWIGTLVGLAISFWAFVFLTVWLFYVRPPQTVPGAENPIGFETFSRTASC